ncbi:aldehyde dehydrogenase family protein [Paraburkholderia sediminicola]|uniref:aldehyde dehydrogenase family protein n=1 Tax=Paraburkholderia sediminicola TaxID=458836 RepID=UPI0038B8E314
MLFRRRRRRARRALSHTVSGNVGINSTLRHVAQDDLPFGGVEPSGLGTYHGIEGFSAMSYAKGIFSEGRWNIPDLMRPPCGQLADRALSFLLRWTDCPVTVEPGPTKTIPAEFAMSN